VSVPLKFEFDLAIVTNMFSGGFSVYVPF
jgi:hypothetical protein